MWSGSMSSSESDAKRSGEARAEMTALASDAARSPDLMTDGLFVGRPYPPLPTRSEGQSR